VLEQEYEEAALAFDTFIVYVGVYADVEAAEADYELIKDLLTKAGPNRRLRCGR